MNLVYDFSNMHMPLCSRDEKCNFSSTTGTLCLWTVVRCTVHNKYFLYTKALFAPFREPDSILLGNTSLYVLAPPTWTLPSDGVTQQVYSPADLLTCDKPHSFVLI